MPLQGLFILWTNSTLGATSEPGEPQPVEGATASVWGVWQAPASGLFEISLPQHAVNVYVGEHVDDLLPVSSVVGGVVQFPAETGVAYRIRVTSNPESVTQFSLRLGPVAPNARPETATELIGTNVVAAGWNWTSPGTTGSFSGAAWWRWTAPQDGLLSASVRTNVVRPILSAFHTRLPTVSSNMNVVPGFAGPIRPSASSQTFAVKSGVTYLFAASALPTTNLVLHLSLSPVEVDLGALSDALLGGSTVWTLQTNVFFSGPDALQCALPAVRQQAWLEAVFTGPGLLRYSTRIAGSSGDVLSFSSSDRPEGTAPIEYRGPHDWVLHTVRLREGTNAVRWTFQNMVAYAATPGIAWLDDIAFVPDAIAETRLGIVADSAGVLHLTVPLGQGQSLSIESSPNLRQWSFWKNVSSETNTTRIFPLQPDAEVPNLFFRARTR